MAPPTGSALAVLVTGASSGIGARVVETLSARGHRVAASMRAVETRNSAARDRLTTLPGVGVVELDVVDDRSVVDSVRAAEEMLGGLDAVVNNAGYGVMGLLEASTPRQAQELFDANVFGPLRVDRAALPAFHRRGSGVLVHVSSSAGRRTLPFGGLYAASKFALEAIAETYRYELAAVGIDSVIVEPGLFDTRLGQNGQDVDDPDRLLPYGEFAQRAAGTIGSGRTPGDPQRVADAIADLLETPTGDRPLRTLVGDDTHPLRRLNALTDDLARSTLAHLGLERLTSPTERPRA